MIPKMQYVTGNRVRICVYVFVHVCVCIASQTIKFYSFSKNQSHLKRFTLYSIIELFVFILFVNVSEYLRFLNIETDP